MIFVSTILIYQTFNENVEVKLEYWKECELETQFVIVVFWSLYFFLYDYKYNIVVFYVPIDVLMEIDW